MRHQGLTSSEKIEAKPSSKATPPPSERASRGLPHDAGRERRSAACESTTYLDMSASDRTIQYGTRALPTPARFQKHRVFLKAVYNCCGRAGTADRAGKTNKHRRHVRRPLRHAAGPSCSVQKQTLYNCHASRDSGHPSFADRIQQIRYMTCNTALLQLLPQPLRRHTVTLHPICVIPVIFQNEKSAEIAAQITASTTRSNAGCWIRG